MPTLLDVLARADKHEWSMKNDREYRNRVEGRSPSLDVVRSGVYNNAGERVTDPVEANIIKGLSMTLEEYWNS
jgi:hypothetical protein